MEAGDGRDGELGEIGRNLQAAGAGDAGAWEWVVRRFTGLLWSVTRSYGLRTDDASDVIQTTWLRLVDSLGKIREPDAVGGWLVTTARHECLSVLRKSGRTVPTDVDEEVADTDAAAGDDLDDRLHAEGYGHPLWKAFGSLSPRCKALLRVLMADPTPSYQEVAAALDMPIGSIGPIRARCLDRLRADPGLVGYQIGDS